VGKKSVIVTVFLIFIFFIFSYFANWCYLTGIVGFCPTSKCKIKSSCVSGGGDFNLGCVGRSWCSWKDDKLKFAYSETSPEEAKQCLDKYIEENKSKFNKLQHIESVYFEDGESNYCHGLGIETAEEDIYCYYYQINTEPVPGDKYNRGWGLTFLVGAQTCNVYPDENVFEDFLGN
jgi:hypothetical protein